MSVSFPATLPTDNQSILIDKAVKNETSLSGDNYYHFSSGTKYTQIALIVLLALFSLSGNFMIVILIKRFPSLRTISNITLANMAVVDILNSLTNLPGFALVGVLNMNHVVRGRSISLAMAITQAFFNNMKVFFMLMMISDRYFAISLGLRYKVWMTYKKMTYLVVLAWAFGISMNVPWFVALGKIDLGDVPTKEYRIVYFDRVGKTASFFVFSICGLAIAVICLLTRRSFKIKLKKFGTKDQNGKDHQGTRRREELTRRDARAAMTIFLTIIAYVVCYLPAILYAVFVGDRSEIARTSAAKWFGFAANFFLFVSSACNPFIYIWRSNRLRLAAKCFFKTPCGSSDFNPHEGLNQSTKKTRICQVSERRKTVAVKSDDLENKGSPSHREEKTDIEEGESAKVEKYTEENMDCENDTFTTNYGFEDEPDMTEPTVIHDAFEICRVNLQQPENEKVNMQYEKEENVNYEDDLVADNST